MSRLAKSLIVTILVRLPHKWWPMAGVLVTRVWAGFRHA